MAKETDVHATSDNQIHLLKNLIDSKVTYLLTMKKAIADHDDALIYELLDSARYNEQVRQWPHADPNNFLSSMTETFQPDLAAFLSAKLIDFIHENFPFLIFKEIKTGVFEIVFGTWPSARTFGLLDIIRIAFIFNDSEMNQLKAFMDDPQTSKEQNLQITELHQANKIYAEKGLASVKKDIDNNKLEIIQLEKNRAILQLECEQIEKYFGSFQHFVDQADHLYTDYLTSF